MFSSHRSLTPVALAFGVIIAGPLITTAISSHPVGRLNPLSVSIIGGDLHAQEEDQEDGCEDINGDERECTPSEEYDQCIEDADDAWFQCRLEADGFWEKYRCDVGGDLDRIACLADLLDAISPFN